MKEFLARAGIPLATLTCVGALATGCSVPIKETIFKDLDCGNNPGNTATLTYGGLQPGEKILLGHPAINGNGYSSDTAITINETGQPVAFETKDGVTVSADKTGAIQITADEERYTVTPGKDSNGAPTLTIVGDCIEEE